MTSTVPNSTRSLNEVVRLWGITSVKLDRNDVAHEINKGSPTHTVVVERQAMRMQRFHVRSETPFEGIRRHTPLCSSFLYRVRLNQKHLQPAPVCVLLSFHPIPTPTQFQSVSGQ
ncbi:hypothetical protein Mapa_013134 [Marchantia paleacea]|nr:hypothetical protein Mapa_013134 [Marchantia paleacea]